MAKKREDKAFELANRPSIRAVTCPLCSAQPGMSCQSGVSFRERCHLGRTEAYRLLLVRMAKGSES